MSLKHRIAILTLMLVTVGTNAQDVRATPDQFFSAIANINETKCKQRGELERSYLQKGDLVAAYAARGVDVNLCDCLPQGLSSIQKSMSKATRETQFSFREFAQQYVVPITAKCSAEGMRATYSLSEGCPQRYKSQFVNSENYCQCMHTAVSGLTDMELYQTGNEGADFSDAFQKAKREGKPTPIPPPSLRKFQDIGATCASTANKAKGLKAP